MICFYHNGDFDGICSAAIIKYKYPKCELYGIDYGDEFPWDTLDDHRRVFMVDYGIQPFSKMIKLVKKNCLIWIDHHPTAIRDYEKYLEKGNEAWFGKREIGKAACELTWEYLFKDREIPDLVHHLGRYDVWDHSDYDTLPIQYGLRAVEEAYNPWNSLWRKAFEGKYSMGILRDDGQVIMRSKKIFNKEYLEKYAFEIEFEGYRTIAVNMGNVSSYTFDSVYDPSKHDLMLAFNYTPQRKWKVSIRTDKETFSCGELAKKYGGGGHSQAAGFHVDDLSSILLQ